MPYADPEKRKNYRKQYAKDHPEKEQKWKQDYIDRHPERRKKSIKDYYENHKTEIMSKSAIQRLKRKLKLIKLFGGKCNRCGYDKCIDALEFHHLDPSEKEGKRDWYRKGFENKQIELLCSNCHKEEHSRWKNDKTYGGITE